MDGMSLTYGEIRNQPRSWAETIAAMGGHWASIKDAIPSGEEAQALFVGSGTSLYIAQAAAAVFQEATGHVSRATPASEVFLSPGTTVPRRAPTVGFLISRSGATSEAVLAAEHLRRSCPNVATVAVTCNRDTALAAATDHAIELPFANDRSVVMTQSFTCMLLALQLVAADVAGARALRAELELLPGLLGHDLDRFEAFGKDLGERSSLRRFVFLGLGPNAGLAEEGTLKLKEMTQVPCEAYNPLEFRHGPISTVADDTAAIILEGDRDRSYLGDVERDLRRLGATVATIGPFPAAAADLALLLPGGLSDLARGPLYIPALQFLAYHRALLLGLDPDRPRNLNPVVVLNGR